MGWLFGKELEPIIFRRDTAPTTGAINPVIAIAVMKNGAAAIFATIGISGSFVSMVRVEPSGWLITMVIASYFCFLMVFFSDRVESFSLRKLEAKLSDVEKLAVEAEKTANQAIQIASEASGSGSVSSH